MLKNLNYICLLFSLGSFVQAETSISSSAPNARQISASASIRIRVHIPVRATLKLEPNLQQFKVETNLAKQNLILSCNNRQVLSLVECSKQPKGQFFTLTTL